MNESIMGERPESRTPQVPVTDMGEGWREMPLEKELLIKNVHPYILRKFKSTDIPKSNSGSRKMKSADGQADEENQSDDDDEDDENKWLCDGSNKLKGGCKSDQKDFDYHIGTEGWTCPRDDTDFDLCEMCIRWAMHCEKHNLDVGFIKDNAADGDEM